MKKAWIAGLITLLYMSAGWAKALDIVVVGLFNGQAVVQINKQQRLLKVGDISPEGVQLISANSNAAVLEINGVQQKYPLGMAIGSKFTAPEEWVVHLWPTNGMYLTDGNINGIGVAFLVDTGAATVAINAATARLLGIDFLNSKKSGYVTTASGQAMAYLVMLDHVQIGSIKLHNIEAVVLNGTEPRVALLGMTFLSQLEMKNQGQRLELRKKY